MFFFTATGNWCKRSNVLTQRYVFVAGKLSRNRKPADPSFRGSFLNIFLIVLFFYYTPKIPKVTISIFAYTLGVEQNRRVIIWST